jgi:hypothetical protein
MPRSSHQKHFFREESRPPAAERTLAARQRAPGSITSWIGMAARGSRLTQRWIVGMPDAMSGRAACRSTAPSLCPPAPHRRPAPPLNESEVPSSSRTGRRGISPLVLKSSAHRIAELLQETTLRARMAKNSAQS